MIAAPIPEAIAPTLPSKGMEESAEEAMAEADIIAIMDIISIIIIATVFTI